MPEPKAVNSMFARIAARLSHRPLAKIALHARQRLDGTWRLISSLSHESVLQRGFALVRDASGKAVTSAAQISAGDAFKVELRDGTIDAIARGSGSSPARPAPKAARKSPPPGQGDLF